MDDALGPWTRSPAGARVHARLTPRSSRDAIERVETLSDGRRVFKARVRAVPEKGAANEALIRLFAKALSVAPSDVRLASGGTSRLKTLDVDGDPARLAASLEGLTRGLASVDWKC